MLKVSSVPDLPQSNKDNILEKISSLRIRKTLPDWGGSFGVKLVFIGEFVFVHFLSTSKENEPKERRLRTGEI